MSKLFCRIAALALLGLSTMSAQAVTYSIDAISHTAGGSPNEDDLMNPGPALAVPGIGVSGVEVDAMSYGRTGSISPLDVEVYFSVTRGSVGLPGTGVAGESLFGDHSGDIFVSTLTGSNIQFRDGNGVMINPLTPGAPSPGLGLFEPIPAFPPGDDVDALDLRLAPVPVPGLGPSIFWSVDPATAGGVGVYVGLGATAADVFWSPALVGYSGVPTVYAPAALLGLLPGDDIDALVWFEDDVGGMGSPGPTPDDVAIFSLTPGSPTLAALGYLPGTGGADLFITKPGGAVSVFAPAGALGLLPDDDINALDVVPEPNVLALIGLGAIASTLRRRRA